jgi:uncharacterized protein YebE (UPF0316 family)
MDFSVFLSGQAWVGALVIFLLRVIGLALGTARLLFVMRGRKLEAWMLGFISQFIIIIALGSVLAELDNPLNILGYAAGMATGGVVGIMIDQHLAIGHVQITIISPALGSAIAEKLRTVGYAVTEIAGQGKDGVVAVLYCDVLRRDLKGAVDIVNEIDPDAFISSENIRPLRRGYWRK